MAGNNGSRRCKKSSMSLSTRITGFVISLALLGLISFYMWREYNRPDPVVYDQAVSQQPEEAFEPSAPEPEAEPLPEPAQPVEEYYPTGTIIDTPARKAYADGDMTIQIPRIGLEGPVLDGVTDEVLARGVGLFDQAQLPGPMEHNANVSIAGHRDIFGMEFYDIDKIVEGDKIILTYQGNVYSYEVEQSFVTNSEDWEPIKVKEYPCVTLQSCTPIGKAVDRIFVVGRLVEITPDQSGGDSVPSGRQLPDGLQLDTDHPTQI